MSDAESFVDGWSRVWRGRDSDPQLYMELLHEGCPLINPISPGKREDLPPFELHGADRFTLRDGKASEGVSYFDPRPFLEGDVG